jgi:protein-L-isoaspartate(D-aspartate) O-methyltransferase
MHALKDDYKHRGLRKSLVKIVAKKGITDSRVLDAIGKVPRHFFFEQAFLEHAYQDKAFPIGEGQTISQPYTVAFQTQLLDLKSGDKVLEIGTGSGYQACVLLEAGAKVFSIEYNRTLHEESKKKLRLMGYKAKFRHGDGSLGWPSMAPFDKIIVTAGAPTIPKQLIDQLNVGGVLVIPVGNEKRQRMLKITKQAVNKLVKEEHDYFCFVPLVGKEGWKV